MNVTDSSVRFAASHQPKYDHVQSAPTYWLVLLPAVVLLAVGISLRAEVAAVPLAFAVAATVLALLAFSFRLLRIRDEGDWLSLQFGPIPIFRKRFAYSDLGSVDRDKSSWVDGWGIHWVPFRGWTYNLWGFDCIRLTLRNGRTIRIGTDDLDGLHKFLNEKLRQSTASHCDT